MSRAMRCFVACAFGKEDVDRIYDRAICPVLRELSFTPLRVDRHEHNDDIDDKIFELLDSSDCCIADLTYARPSVYYEAGYASGNAKPVVYTARSDHLRPTESDQLGNLRVHFDLLMRNIIDWNDANTSFKKRLCSRLRHVLRPLLRQRKQDRILAEDMILFKSMSQSEQLECIHKKARDLLYARGFKGIKGEEQKRKLTSLCRLHGSTNQEVHLAAEPRLTKAQLDSVSFGLGLQDVSAEEWFLLIASLHSVSESMLANAFPLYSQVGSKVLREPVNPKFLGHPRTNTIAVIDSIKSLAEFTERFRVLCKLIDLD